MEAKIVFNLEEKEEFTILSFNLRENLNPEILKNLHLPNVNQKKGLIISGRGPIWLYCFLTHLYHPTKFIAVYDPRIGAVVVESHVNYLREGDVIEVNLE